MPVQLGKIQGQHASAPKTAKTTQPDRSHDPEWVCASGHTRHHTTQEHKCSKTMTARLSQHLFRTTLMTFFEDLLLRQGREGPKATTCMRMAPVGVSSRGVTLANTWVRFASSVLGFRSTSKPLDPQPFTRKPFCCAFGKERIPSNKCDGSGQRKASLKAPRGILWWKGRRQTVAKQTLSGLAPKNLAISCPRDFRHTPRLLLAA